MIEKQNINKNEKIINPRDEFESLRKEFGFEDADLSIAPLDNIDSITLDGTEGQRIKAQQNLLYSEKFNMYSCFNTDEEYIEYYNPDGTTIGVTSFRAIAKGMLKKLFRSYILRKKFQNEEKQHRIISQESDTSQEIVTKSLKGKILYRFAIPQRAKLAESDNSHLDLKGQYIIMTANGVLETINSHYAQLSDYQIEADDELDPFAIHETYHTLVIPIVHMLFKKLALQASLKNQRGIYNQSFSVFYEMLVDGLTYTFNNFQGTGSSVEFNFGLALGHTLSSELEKAMSEEERKQFIQYITQLSTQMYNQVKQAKKVKKIELNHPSTNTIDEIKAQYLPKTDRSKQADIVAQYAPILSQLAVSNNTLNRPSKSAKWHAEEDSIIESSRGLESDLNVDFDFSKFPGIVDYISKFDELEFTRPLFKKTYDTYLDIKSWEDSNFENLRPAILGTYQTNGITLKSSQFVIDSFIYWISSLGDEGLVVARDLITQEFAKLLETQKKLTKPHLQEYLSKKLTDFEEFANKILKNDKYIDRDNYVSELSGVVKLNEYSEESQNISGKYWFEDKGPENFF
jgi:hypothetical protein